MRKVFLATLLIAMMSAATVFAANWQQIYTDQNDNEIFFDIDSMKIFSGSDLRMARSSRMILRDCQIVRLTAGEQ